MSSDEFEAYDEFTEQDFAAIDAAVARAQGGRIQIAIQQQQQQQVKDSPFKRFLSWKKYLGVTDLVSPIWCEVQYEYGLYGKRNKPIHLRPIAFVSKNGKSIRVKQHVANVNDQRLKRGKSVHKALEEELRPEKLVVPVVTEEERFGLRLVQLIDGFNELTSNGITRELPVFAITHDQVVLGVIDEVVREPLSHPAQDQASSPTPAPGSPPKKKQRLVVSPTQQIILESPTAQDTVCGTEQTDFEDPYEFHITDYKTRRSKNVPLDVDSLSPRLQLMMYHRMLSSVLEPDPHEFDVIWSRLNLDPMKPFSALFIKGIQWEQRQSDPTDRVVHLNRLVSEWISVVQRRDAGFKGVSRRLQIVYRRSVYAESQREKGKHKATEMVDIDDPLEALLLQEELDLARAIEQSLSEMGHQDATQVARHVAENVKQVGPSSIGRTSAVWKDLISPLDFGQTDPTLTWAIQQSLLTSAHKTLAQVRANKLQQADTIHDLDEANQQVQEGSTMNISPIIGRREFEMDDDELDKHIADVLQWWFGARPPRGVDVAHTNRCFTCEYQESCEWREKKASEAVVNRNRDW